MMWIYGPENWFPWMLIFPFIFLICLAVLLVWMIRGGGPMCGGHPMHPKEDSARDILDRRYARGEITPEEYQRMKKDIQA